MPIESGIGPQPTLPPPRQETIPTVHIAPARGWAEDAKPLAAAALAVNRFAEGLDHPRWLFVLPNGDVLVAETRAPPAVGKKPLRDRIMALVMKRAGAGGPSANRISLLRDADGDGIAETHTSFLEGLNSPFGMALAGGWLYIANTDAIVRVPYKDQDLIATAVPVKVLDLPGGPINHHWTKNLIASPDGARLYVTVGSNSNVGENGEANEEGRAAVWEVDVASGQAHVFASGLRNPNGLAWEPDTGVLWVAVNERDEIGGNLVPDYITALREGGFYGWPYSYYGQHIDERVNPQRPDLVVKAIKPDYALGSHTGSLGLTFTSGDGRLGDFRKGAFIGQHGSWNRRPRSGYKVLFVPFANGHPVGPAVDVLTGFVNSGGDALGRPVGVVFDSHNALLVADDVGNVIWRVTNR